MALDNVLSVTYNGLTVGGTSDVYLLDGRKKYVHSEEHRVATFEAQVMVIDENDDENAQIAARQALVDAFSEPNKRLQLVQSGAGVIDYNPAAFSALEVRPRVTKEDDEATHRISTAYTIAFEITLPADDADGRDVESTSIEIHWDEADIRTITFSGIWTADPDAGDNAIDAFDNNFSTWSGGVLTTLGVTNYEEVTTSKSPNDPLTELDYTVTYRELVYQQAVGVMDDTDLVNISYNVVESKPQLGNSEIDGQIPSPLSTVTVNFSGFIRKGVDMRSKYEAVIRPGAFAAADAMAPPPGARAKVQEDPGLDPVHRTFSGQIVFRQTTGKSLVSGKIVVTTEDDFGVRHRGVYGGGPFDADEARTFRSFIRTTTTEKTVVSASGRSGFATTSSSGADLPDRFSGVTFSDVDFGLERGVHDLLFADLGNLQFVDAETGGGGGGPGGELGGGSGSGGGGGDFRPVARRTRHHSEVLGEPPNTITLQHSLEVLAERRVNVINRTGTGGGGVQGGRRSVSGGSRRNAELLRNLGLGGGGDVG